MNVLIPFSFEEVRLKESYWIQGKPYFTRRAFGEWLGYVKPRPDVAIAKIVDRNPHIRQFATVVKLTTVDEYPKGHSVTNLVTESTTRTREIETELYDPIGLQLIVMESRQPKAIQYKIAVAHLVVAYMRGELVPVSPFENRLSDLINLRPQSRRRAEAVRKMASEMRLSTRTIYTHLQRIENGEPVRKKRSFLRGYSWKYGEETYNAVIEYIKTHPKEYVVNAARVFGIPKQTVYDWIRKSGYSA